MITLPLSSNKPFVVIIFAVTVAIVVGVVIIIVIIAIAIIIIYHYNYPQQATIILFESNAAHTANKREQRDCM